MSAVTTVQKTKDPVVSFRTTIKGKNSKGGDRVQLYLDAENAKILIQALTEQLANPTGVKIDMHTDKKTNSQNGRQFDSTYAFVKAVQGDDTTTPTSATRFVPRQANAAAQTLNELKAG